MPIQLSGSLVITGSITTTGGITISGSILSASYSDTASFSNNFRVLGNLTASTALVTGTLTAQTLVVQTVTSSIVYSSGSNLFGSVTSNLQTFTGSIQASGSSTHFFLGGNVGIGTTSTSGVFEVAKATSSNINLANFFNSGSTIGTENYMWIGKDGTTAGRAGLIDFIDNTDPSGSYLAFGIQGDNPKANDGLFIKKASKIGIGNNYPSRSLHVGAGGDSPQNPNNGIYVSNNGTTAVIVRDSTNHSEYTIQVQGNAAIVGTLTTHDLVTYTNNTERMRIASGSGYVGIGTTTPYFSLDVSAPINNQGIRITSVQAAAFYLYSTYNTANNRNWGIYTNSNIFGDFDIRQSIAKDGDMTQGANGASRLYIKNDGSVGVGTVSPSTFFHISGSSTDNLVFVNNTQANGYASVRCSNNGNKAAVFGVGGSSVGSPYANNGYIYTDSGLDLILAAGASEKARITSGGNFYLRNTAEIAPGSVTNSILQVTNPNNDGGWALAIQSNATSSPNGRGIGIKFNTDFNNSSNEVIWFVGGSVNRFVVESDGGIRNFSANNANLSDERVKKDIVALESYWNKFKAIGIVKFKYKDQTHDDYNIGVIAQQVESIAPEFVNNDGWGETPENSIPLKSIYETDLYHATIKVLQEAMAKIETLEAKVTALETK